MVDVVFMKNFVAQRNGPAHVELVMTRNCKKTFSEKDDISSKRTPHSTIITFDCPSLDWIGFYN